MLVNDIIQKVDSPINLIREMCGDFLKESNGLPVYRMLPESYQDIQRVKVRAKKKNDVFTKTFNEAFSHTYNLRQRSLFAYPLDSLSEEENKEPFYVFPVDGYSYLYNKEVKNSDKRGQNAMDVITKDIMVEMLKYTYNNDNLTEGLTSGAEIMFFNIPAFYAARCSAIDYNSILC